MLFLYLAFQYLSLSHALSLFLSRLSFALCFSIEHVLYKTVSGAFSLSCLSFALCFSAPAGRVKTRSSLDQPSRRIMRTRTIRLHGMFLKLNWSLSTFDGCVSRHRNAAARPNQNSVKLVPQGLTP